MGVSAQSDCLFRSTLCLKLVGFLDLALFSDNLFATAADLAHFSNTAQHWYARLVAPGGQGNDIPLMKQKKAASPFIFFMEFAAGHGIS